MRNRNNKIMFLLALLVALLYLFNMVASYKTMQPIQVSAQGISAKAMVVLDVDSGRVLAQKNANTRLAMASTTKIMTALVAIEEVEDLETMVNIDDRAVGIEGTSIYLRKGEQMPLRELLLGLMLASGNDASLAIGYFIGKGSMDDFVDKMNQKAVEIGALDTHFANPHGLDAKEHYTTALDLARITAYAHKNEQYKEIAGTRKGQITSTPEGHNRFLLNKQRLLTTYDLCIGGKTGFTDDAGRCSVCVAKKDDLTLVCVVLNAPSMFEDSKLVLNNAFANYRNIELLKPYSYIDSLPIEQKEDEKVKVYSERGFSYPLLASEIKDIKIEKELPSLLKPPLKKEEPVGKIKIYLGKDLIFLENIYTIESVETEEFSNKIKEIIKRWFYD